MRHERGVAPLMAQCAGQASPSDVVAGSDPDLMAAVSRDEETDANRAMEETVMRRMPRLTGFWIVRRDAQIGIGAVREANNREVETAVVWLIHRREREKGGACECKQMITHEEFCCYKCPLKAWEVEGKYRPLERDIGRWKSLEARSCDWTSAIDDASYEPFLEEEVWGVDNERIMQRLYEQICP